VKFQNHYEITIKTNKKMTTLSNNQKKFLRKLAHDLNPVIMIGQNGLTQNVIDEMLLTMEKHELLKLKVRVEKDEKQSTIDKILEVSKAEIIQVVGNVVVIYKPFDDEPQIVLPRK
jgi:RNA-binding protein